MEITCYACPSDRHHIVNFNKIEGSGVVGFTKEDIIAQLDGIFAAAEQYGFGRLTHVEFYTDAYKEQEKRLSNIRYNLHFKRYGEMTPEERAKIPKELVDYFKEKEGEAYIDHKFPIEEIY